MEAASVQLPNECCARANEGGTFCTKADKETELIVGRRLKSRFGDRISGVSFYNDNTSLVDGWFETPHSKTLSGVFLEVKGRSHRFGTFDTLFLCPRKYERLVALYNTAANWDVWLVWYFKGCETIAYATVRDLIDVSPLECAVFHRKVVRANNDIEPLLSIPLSYLKVMRDA